MSDYLEVNLANWNSRVPHHAAGYGLERFTDDAEHLSDVVRFDLPRLGDLTGLDVVHLQCHLGTDTLSLHRLGARNVTGLDFSQPALDVAAALAGDCGASIDYVCADVYGAVEALGREQFDLVFTGIGALCWLPDLAAWARTVADLLRPGGRLFLREGHPVLWSLADARDDGVLVIDHPYFVTEGERFSESTSYLAHDGELAAPDTVQFNHGLAEVITALLDAGLVLRSIVEHDSVPWNPLGDAMHDIGGGEFRLRDRPERLPASYTLQAERPG